MNTRRKFLKHGSLWVPALFFTPRLLAQQGLQSPQFVAGLGRKPAATGGGTPQSILTSFTGGTTGQTNNWYGCKFTVGGTALKVSQLLVYLAATDGYSASTPIAIRASNGTTVVKSTTIDLSGGNNTVGWHASASFAEVTLDASTVYFMACDMQYQSSKLSNSSITWGSAITVNDACFDSSGTWLEEGAGAGKCYHPLDFKYTT